MGDHISSYMGLGTAFCGERDYLTDGTWVTTEWLIVAYVPLVPLRSVRIRPAEGGFEEFHERAPHRKQVVCVYLFVLTLGLSLYGALRLAIHANSLGLFYLLFIPVFASLLAVKWWLRKQAMKRAGVAPVREPRWWNRRATPPVPVRPQLPPTGYMTNAQKHRYLASVTCSECRSKGFTVETMAIVNEPSWYLARCDRCGSNREFFL